MTPQEIMMGDARKLRDWGFTVPMTAVNGDMDVSDWNDWVEGNGSTDVEYIPRNLEAYIDFHRKMTEKGRWKYDEESLASLRQRFSTEAVEERWEKILEDFRTLPREEYKAKHPYMPETLREIVEWSQREIKGVEDKIKKQQVFLTEGEDDSDESVIRNVFNRERRVAIRNTMQLIEMAKENPAYTRYLHDMMRMGGSDWYANEQVLKFFDLTDDVEGLRIAAQNLTEAENLRYVYSYLAQHGDLEFVIPLLSDETPLEAYRGFLSWHFDQYFGWDATKKSDEDIAEVREWAERFIEEQRLLERLEAAAADKENYKERFDAHELSAVLLKPFRYMMRDSEEERRYGELARKLRDLYDRLGV
jgi:hypothetical protein